MLGVSSTVGSYLTESQLSLLEGSQEKIKCNTAHSIKITISKSFLLNSHRVHDCPSARSQSETDYHIPLIMTTIQ